MHRLLCQKVHQPYRPSFAFSSQNRFSKLSHNEAPDGRGLTFVPDKSWIRIDCITQSHSLFPLSHRRIVIGTPRGQLSPSLEDEIRHCHVPHKYLNEWLRCCLYPDGVNRWCSICVKPTLEQFHWDHLAVSHRLTVPLAAYLLTGLQYNNSHYIHLITPS